MLSYIMANTTRRWKSGGSGSRFCAGVKTNKHGQASHWSRFRVQGLGFRVEGLGFRVSDPEMQNVALYKDTPSS